MTNRELRAECIKHTHCGECGEKENCVVIEVRQGEWLPIHKQYIDYVKVVRCKDCKHLVEIDPDNLYVCDRIDIGMDGEPSFLSPENDFCSKGERKETNE